MGYLESIMNSKCNNCYAIQFCILTVKMRDLCGGPFKDRKGQIAFILTNISTKRR